jgi:hypothetical protein
MVNDHLVDPDCEVCMGEGVIYDQTGMPLERCPRCRKLEEEKEAYDLTKETR